MIQNTNRAASSTQITESNTLPPRCYLSNTIYARDFLLQERPDLVVVVVVVRPPQRWHPRVVLGPQAPRERHSCRRPRGP